jgi:plastocyanin
VSKIEDELCMRGRIIRIRRGTLGFVGADLPSADCVTKGGAMRDWLKMTPIRLYLVLALVLWTGCSQERSTGQPGGSAVSSRRAATSSPTDQNEEQTSAYISGVSAPIADRSGGDLSGKEAIVHMTNGRTFVPAEVTITAGQGVVWINGSNLVHTVTADPSWAQNAKNVQLPPGAQPFNSGGIAPGGTFRHVFEEPGTYRYFCIPHEDEGMVGTVIVKEKQ